MDTRAESRGEASKLDIRMHIIKDKKQGKNRVRAAMIHQEKAILELAEDLLQACGEHIPTDHIQSDLCKARFDLE